MAKFKKALALVLSLAMVLTLAPIANVQTKAASKYKIKAATTAIAAGKTYNVKVTGVSKKQYVKISRTAGVTVKYNGKTIKASKKVVGTGKTLTFKVTVPDKVANYNSTIKAVIYNKKTNKKVKTLSTKRTVKVSEFSIASVVSTTEATASGFKYIRATFTKAIDSLDASEVEITEKATGQIFSVEKAALATNGKSVDITLVGDVAAAGTTFLQANTDYVLNIKKAGATAHLDFSIPQVEANAAVMRIDPSKKQITLRSGTVVTIPDSITVDYNEILGRDVTVKYDKDLVASSLTVNNQKVIYGSFNGTVDGADQFFKDNLTGEKYYLQTTTPATGTIWTSSVISKTATGWGAPVTTTVVAGTETWGWAKLVLNTNGTIKTAVVDATAAPLSTSILVEKVVGDNLVNGTTEKNVKDFTILKDGKTIKVSDVAAGDVVFIDTTNKFADVYTSKKEGALGNVYATQFVFEGGTYNFAQAWYVDGKLKACDADYMAALKASGKNITVYFDRSNVPAYILGDKGEVKTTTTNLVLTADAKAFAQSLVNYVRVTGYDTEAKAVKTYDIDVTKLTSLTNNAGVSFTVGKATKTSYSAAANVTPTGFTANVANYSATGATATDGIKVVWSAGNTDVDGVTDSATTGTNAVGVGAANAMKLGEKIGLTFDDKNTVVGINYAAGQDISSIDSTAIGTIGAFGTKTFKAGYKTINGFQLVDGTMIYIVDGAKQKVTATKYGEFAGTVTAVTALAAIQVYGSDGVASAVVVDSSRATIVGASDDGDVFRAVVSRYNKDVTGQKSALLEVVVGTETKKFETFDDSVVGTWTTGDVVDVTPNKAGTRINGVSATIASAASGAYVQTSDQDKTFTIGGTAYAVAAKQTCTIVKFNKDAQGNNIVEPIGFSALNGTDKVVNVTTVAGSTSAVDTIVVTATATATPAPVATGLTISMPSAAGTPVIATTSTLKIVKAGENLTVSTTGMGTIEEVKWYVAADNTSGYVRKSAWDDDLTTGAGLTAGQCAYAVVTDSAGVTKESEKVEAAASVATSLSATTDSTGHTTTGLTPVTITNITVLDQFGKAMTTGSLTANSAGTVTRGTTPVATDDALLIKNDANAGFTLVSAATNTAATVNEKAFVAVANATGTTIGYVVATCKTAGTGSGDDVWTISVSATNPNA